MALGSSLKSGLHQHLGAKKKHCDMSPYFSQTKMGFPMVDACSRICGTIANRNEESTIRLESKGGK